MKLLSVVIPVFNEEESVELLYKQIKSIGQNKLKKMPIEIIFVNDGSTDSTVQKITSLHKKDASVKMISFKRNRGKATALSEGFKLCKGEIIMTMDGDLQDGAENIPSLLKKLENYDLVVGWKKKRKDPLGKIIPSRTFNLIVGFFSKIPLHDFNSGLKIMKAEVAHNLELYGELHRFIPVLAFQKGYSVSEVAVIHHPRRFGKSKYGASRLLSGLFDFITVLFIGSYSKRPFHFFGLFGALGLLLGIIFGIYLSILHFLGEGIGNRPLLILSVLLIVSGLQTLSFGLIAELLTRQSHHKDHPPIDKILK